MPDLIFFSPAAYPADERRRQAVLDALGILDTPPDPVFDDIVAEAALETGMPIAAISLVDHTRQWFLARIGLDVTETPRVCSFCSHAMLDPAHVMQVPDARKDERFQGNPLVTAENGIRFYAGAPLVMADGTVLGALCVIDTSTRPPLTADISAKLVKLASRAVAAIEARAK